MDFTISVNNRIIDVSEGETLLLALRRNGIKVPTLCHMNRFSPTGACRLCVVEVEGKRDLITSCSYPVEPNMKVLTNSPRVIKARKSLVELLLSNHPDDCLYCQRNGNCELQWLAEEMNVKERKYASQKQRFYPEYAGISVARDMAKCILCSRCVRMCEEVQLVTAIDFIHRSNKTTVNSAFDKGLNVSSCISCGQCITVCPTAALLDISHLEKVQAAIDHEKKQVVFLVSPSTIASVAEELGIKPNEHAEGVVAAALKKCGADKVYHLGAACDSHIEKEAKYLSNALKNGLKQPVISSCCPAWVRYVEVFRPQWKSLLSGYVSPQQKMGVALKFDKNKKPIDNAENLYCVAVMPCVAKKFEASREEYSHKGISEIDSVLTLREFFRMIRTNGIDMGSIEPEPMDEPFNKVTAAAFKMGYSGGKAEAVAYEMHLQDGGDKAGFKFSLPRHTASKREARIKCGNQEIGFAWVSGIAEADAYLQTLMEEDWGTINYVEVMACQGGCAGGGGQPINRNPQKPKNRKKLCQEMEKFCHVKSPSERQ